MIYCLAWALQSNDSVNLIFNYLTLFGDYNGQDLDNLFTTGYRLNDFFCF